MEKEPGPELEALLAQVRREVDKAVKMESVAIPGESSAPPNENEGALEEAMDVGH